MLGSCSGRTPKRPDVVPISAAVCAYNAAFMQTHTPSSEAAAPQSEPAAAPAPDKSRFTFQKLLQPFTVHRGIATPIIWFLLDWLVLAVALASMMFVDAWWVRLFASLVAALWI